MSTGALPPCGAERPKSRSRTRAHEALAFRVRTDEFVRDDSDVMSVSDSECRSVCRLHSKNRSVSWQADKSISSFEDPSPVSSCSYSPREPFEEFATEVSGSGSPLLGARTLSGMDARTSSSSLLVALERKDSEFIGDTMSVFSFPLWAESLLQPLDDPLLAACQLKTKGIVKKFSKFWTFVTALEAGLVWSIVLFAFGFQETSRLFTCVLFSLSVLSQIPKRFVWRPRPWMVFRAEGVRKDKTSSFPSRAAACSVVFPLLILAAYKEIVGREARWWAAGLFLMVSIFSTGFARVNVGAHYPSDILGGLVMGLVVWRTGVLMTDVLSVLNPMMRAVLPMEVRFVLATTLSFGANMLCMEHFWAKCSFVFGILCAALTFDVTFDTHTTQWSIAYSGLAVVLGLLILAYGMIAHKRKGFAWQTIVFAQVFFLSLSYMLFFNC